MKGRGLFTVLVLALVCVAPAHASVLQSLDGTGTTPYPAPIVGPGQVTVTISAHRVLGGGAVGVAQAQGSLTGTSAGDFTATGPVTCLTVAGTQASYKFRIAVGTGAALALQGGGMSGFVRSNAAAPGLLQPAATFDLAPSTCDDPAIGLYQPLSGGQYTVTGL
jgi:hypothetical protein